MEVLGSKTDPVPILEPGVCFICETFPDQQAGTRIVDTERTFNPPVHTRLNGRKIVCSNCVKEMGRLVGMEFSSETERIKLEFETYRQGVQILQQRITDFANDVTHVTTFVPSSSVPALTEVPTPNAIPVDPPASEVSQEPVAEQKTKEGA